MVFYRKYRPQTISELDIESVRDRLSSILSSKEIPHAFLFTGPKGLGKTSSARILAKAINCEKRAKGSIEPCNTCDACESITNGSNIDVIEIDAASNRGVDEIRELRERVKYAPAKAHKKVYIIDEVHMLTNEAFNALLKTLEEPPSHVLFILCTTELQKVPETIVSRTFQINFDFPSKEETLRSIQRILDGEKLKADESTLNAIYLRAGGSFRDAAKIVEELSITSSDGVLTESLLEKVYSLTTISDGIEHLLVCLSSKNADEGLKILSQFIEKGIDFKTITELLLERLRSLLLAKVRGEQEVLQFTSEALGRLIDEVSESYRRMKFSPIQSLPLELVIARWGMGESSIQKRAAEDKIPAVKNEDKNGDEKKSVKDEIEKVPEIVFEKAEKAPDVKGREISKAEEKTKTGEPKEDQQDHGELFTSMDKNFYDALLQAVKQDNHSIVGVLRGCKLLTLGENGVVLFQTKFKFHKDKLSEPKIRDIIEKRASEILHKKITVEIQLQE